jgi:hypothetical protein
MAVLVDRAKMTTGTTGTGTISLGSAVSGYQSFADAGVTDGNVVRYVIEDGASWEIGTGTYTSSGTTLSRTPEQSSSGGSAISLSGNAFVFVTAAADDIVTPTGTQTLTNKTISADNNTISGLAASSFVLSNGSGNIDGAASQKAVPNGVVVGTTDTQTLTNKTLTDPAIIGTILEDIYTISDGAAFEVDPSNGSIQLITLGANRTPKATNFAAGEAVTLMVDDGSAYTLTWTDATWGSGGVIWKTDSGSAPTLNTSGYTVIVFWKVSTQVYGARVGNA